MSIPMAFSDIHARNHGDNSRPYAENRAGSKDIRGQGAWGGQGWVWGCTLPRDGYDASAPLEAGLGAYFLFTIFKLANHFRTTGRSLSKRCASPQAVATSIMFPTLMTWSKRRIAYVPRYLPDTSSE